MVLQTDFLSQDYIWGPACVAGVQACSQLCRPWEEETTPWSGRPQTIRVACEPGRPGHPGFAGNSLGHLSCARDLDL